MSDFPVYALTDEHQAIREAVRAVAEAKIAPHAAAVDEEARYPSEAEKALIGADFHAPHVPEEYGGAGADALATVLVIEEVARRRTPDPRAVPGLDRLTEREVEVLRLMARGMSNSEIAGQLYLGEATVKTHVGRVLGKLDARDRVQAVVAAYESGLVEPGAR